MDDLCGLELILLAAFFLIGVVIDAVGVSQREFNISLGNGVRGCLRIDDKRLDGGADVPLCGVARERLSFVSDLGRAAKVYEQSGDKNNRAELQVIVTLIIFI